MHEVFRFSNPHHYRHLRWDGISCVELVWEYADTRAVQKTPRLCKRSAFHGPDKLLCRQHARIFRAREALVAEYEKPIRQFLNWRRVVASQVIMPALQEVERND